MMARYELHNVAETVKTEGEGALFQRVPEAVRRELREASQSVYQAAAGCEIRLVAGADASPVRITLVSQEAPSQAYFYMGDFAVSAYTIGTEPTTIELAPPELCFLTTPIADSPRLRGAFAPQVWRLLFQGGRIQLLNVEGEGIRAPRAEELPSLRYLAYGTSITQGYSATHPALSYVSQTAWRLKADVINLGASGTAFCEPALAHYIADRTDWDILTLCLSVNMLGLGVSAAEFEEKAGYFVRTIAEAHQGKPIACISLFPSYHDLGLSRPNRHPVSTAAEYREVLRGIAEDKVLPNVHYIDGRELLSDMRGLTQDLLHPDDQGMIEIGEKLAPRLSAMLNAVK